MTRKTMPIADRTTKHGLSPQRKKRKEKRRKQEERWRLEASDDTRLVLRLTKVPKRSSKQYVTATAHNPLQGILSMPKPFPAGVRVRLRPPEPFVDELADAMGFGGPPPPSASSRYFDLAESTATTEAQLLTLLGFPVLSDTMKHQWSSSPPPSSHLPEWKEADPTPGFLQMLDAPDLSRLSGTDTLDDQMGDFFVMEGHYQFPDTILGDSSLSPCWSSQPRLWDPAASISSDLSRRHLQKSSDLPKATTP